MPLDANDLAKMTDAKIEPVPPNERVLGFFSVTEIDKALGLTDFDVEEEIKTVVEISRGDDPKLTLQAYKYLQDRIKSAAQAEGLFARLEQTEVHRDGDGHEVKRVASTSTLIQRLQQEKVRERNLDADADHRAERHLPGDVKAKVEPAVLRDRNGRRKDAARVESAADLPAGNQSAGGHGDPEPGGVGRTSGRAGEADARPDVRGGWEHPEHPVPEATAGAVSSLGAGEQPERADDRDVPRRITVARGVRRRAEGSDG